MPVIMHEHPLSHPTLIHMYSFVLQLVFSLVTLTLMLMYHLIVICKIFCDVVNHHALTLIPTGHTRVTNSSATTST